MSLSEGIKGSGDRLKERVGSWIEFLRETRKELHNVSWPSWTELRGTTMVVIVTIFVFGFYLYIVDLIVHAGMQYVFRVGQ